MARTRTVLLWYDNDAERLTLPVNPAQMTLTRGQETQTFRTVGGDPLHVACGPGLTEVAFQTFLPDEGSRFYTGVAPTAALAMLQRWQSVRRPVRLIISDAGVNDAFLLTEVRRTLTEGDRDIGVALRLREYVFTSLQSGALSRSAGGLLPRADERVTPRSYTVRKGDTLWAVAQRFYGDGTRWKDLARRNGVADPRQLPIGKVLVL